MDLKQDLKIDFETYWELIQPNAEFANRRAASEQEWNRHPEKQRAIIRWLRKNGAYSRRNPYFFILDFQPLKEPQPRHAEPVNLNGTYEAAKMLDEGTARIACYNGKWGTYSIEDIAQFNLQTK